jgi:hypothetical protein
MKRPLESDYTSQAAYTRALEMYCEDDDTQTYKEDGNALLIAYQSGYFDAKKKYKLERNFCERCGKRLGAADHIHTCTPPQETALEKI